VAVAVAVAMAVVVVAVAVAGQAAGIFVVIAAMITDLARIAATDPVHYMAAEDEVFFLLKSVVIF